MLGLSIFTALLFVLASMSAWAACAAQITAWAYDERVRSWKALLESPIPPLRVDFGLFFRGLPEDDHPDVARARHVRYTVIGWKWLRFASLLAFMASLFHLMSALAALSRA